MGFNESERNEYSQRVLAYIAKAGKEPSQLTKEDFVRAIMHTYKGKASRRGNLKRRTIQQLKDKELQFYMKPRAILDKYITNMLEEIQKRDFFITNSKQYRDDMNALQRYETIYDTRDFLDAYYDEAPEKGDPRYKEYQADLARIRRAEKWFAGYNEKKGKAGKELEKLPVPSTDQEMLSVTIDHFKERTNDASGVERIVTELVEAGEITPEQMQTVQEVLQARFAKGSTKNWVRLSKMLMYGLVLGQVPRAALRQLGDFANISMKYGVLPSLKAVGQTVPESLPWIRKQLKTHHHTMQSFGLQDSHAEHIGGGLSADFAKSAFKWSGLTWMDTLMKSSYIRASENEVLSLYKTWKDGGAGSIKAKNKLFKKMEDIFVDETSQVIAEIGENPSGDQMQRYLFHSLMNQFPVTTSNQPQGKMEASFIGQFLYMFKSYNIKLLDALYRNGINQMVHAAKSTEMENTKRVAIFSKGFGQVSKAIGQVVTMNLLATELINLLYNRGGDDDDPYWKELLDNAQNELLQLIFFNRYMSYQFSKGDITQMIGGAITPPATILEKGVQDINAIMKGKLDDGLRTAQYIPFFGGLWYEWFGRGAKQKEKRENRNNKKKSLKRYR